MIREPYYFTAHLEEGVIGRMWLNDLPVQKLMTRGPDSMHGGANHMLVPGKNQLSLEILRLPKMTTITPVGIKIYRVKEPNIEPVVADVVAAVELPSALALLEGRRIEMPVYHTVEFDLPDTLPEGPFYRAPLAEFPCEGNKELVDAVLEVQDALEKLDLPRFLDVISLKHEWWSAAFAGDPGAALDRQREGATEFFALRPAVRPMDLRRLHFEARQGGRVAYVSAWDDGPVLEAVAVSQSGDQPGIALRTNLLLTQHNGRWRVFG